MLDHHGVAVHVAGVAEAFRERSKVGRLFFGTSGMPEYADAWDMLTLLGARRS
jgi:hypothetical protein